MGSDLEFISPSQTPCECNGNPSPLLTATNPQISPALLWMSAAVRGSPLLDISSKEQTPRPRSSETKPQHPTNILPSKHHRTATEMPFALSTADPSHAAAIAKIFLSNETDDFLRLQFGSVDPGVMSRGLAERLAENIATSGQVYIVARDEETGDVVSYCSWTLPRGEGEEVVKASAEVSGLAGSGFSFLFSQGSVVVLLVVRTATVRRGR